MGIQHPRCPLSRRYAQASGNVVHPDEIIKVAKEPVSRRSLLKLGLSGSMATTLAGIDALAWAPKRFPTASAATNFSDIQFDIGRFLGAAQTINGIQVGFGPVFTYMLPAKLNRTPSKADQTTFANALNTIEANFPASSSGLFVHVAYGLPYFNRLPQSLVTSRMPLRNDGSNKPVLEEAVPSPTDVSPKNPQITKKTFNVPVRIESNDVLFTFRSDTMGNITNAVAWLQGSNTLNGKSVTSPAFSGLFSFDVPRVNFVQQGLPRQMANQHNFSFAGTINPASTMWMGFVDQQVNASAPTAATVTFAGTSAAVLTTAKAGDYFDNGSIQHLSHVLDDLAQYYNQDPNAPEDFSERIQYMFRSKTNSGQPGLPYPQNPNDGFLNGGGQNAQGDIFQQQQSAYIDNVFFGSNDQATNFDPAVTDHKKFRVGHTAALQRSSRTSNGTPLHIRVDGPGLSTLDVPGGAATPTLEFTVFVPTAEFFRVMRINSASLDYVKAADGGTEASVPAGMEASDGEDDGLERFLTATRRQNFLIPPRRNRAFPLIELT